MEEVRKNTLTGWTLTGLQKISYNINQKENKFGKTSETKDSGV
jgi:hypothetical protein